MRSALTDPVFLHNTTERCAVLLAHGTHGQAKLLGAFAAETEGSLDGDGIDLGKERMNEGEIVKLKF
jgi:hypothetical protein